MQNRHTYCICNHDCGSKMSGLGEQNTFLGLQYHSVDAICSYPRIKCWALEKRSMPIVKSIVCSQAHILSGLNVQETLVWRNQLLKRDLFWGFQSWILEWRI